MLFRSVDRSREHLVGTDMGIVIARRKLMQAAAALAEQHTPPPGIDPATHRIRSASVVLPAHVPFAEAAADALKMTPGKRHVSV